MLARGAGGRARRRGTSGGGRGRLAEGDSPGVIPAESGAGSAGRGRRLRGVRRGASAPHPARRPTSAAKAGAILPNRPCRRIVSGPARRRTAGWRRARVGAGGGAAARGIATRKGKDSACAPWGGVLVFH